MESTVKSIDLKKLNDQVEKIVADRDWDQFHSVKNLAMALTVEASELQEIFQWMSEAESNQIQNDPKKLGRLEDEVADVFVYLLRILSKTNIDLEQAVLRKLEKNIAKYPVDAARGNSKKYDEF